MKVRHNRSTHRVGMAARADEPLTCEVQKPPSTSVGVALRQTLLTQEVVIDSLRPQSLVDGQLAPGDILLSVNGVPVSSPEQASRLLREASSLSVQARRPQKAGLDLRFVLFGMLLSTSFILFSSARAMAMRLYSAESALIALREAHTRLQDSLGSRHNADALNSAAVKHAQNEVLLKRLESSWRQRLDELVQKKVQQRESAVQKKAQQHDSTYQRQLERLKAELRGVKSSLARVHERLGMQDGDEKSEHDLEGQQLTSGQPLCGRSPPRRFRSCLRQTLGLPAHGIQQGFNSCAVVGSSGSLLMGRWGGEIDQHEVVIRFNNAPVTGYEEIVGARGSVRMLNSNAMSSLLQQCAAKNSCTANYSCCPVDTALILNSEYTQLVDCIRAVCGKGTPPDEWHEGLCDASPCLSRV